MNKIVLILIVITGLTLGGVSIYTLLQPSRPQEKSVPSSQVAPVPTTHTPQTSSRYLEYSPQILAGTKDKKRILFFYASWCPTCIPANADFSQNADSIPEEVAVIRVNYNDPETDEEEKALAQKYGVTYQHTFVQIDMQGNKVTSWNGGQTDELLANIQ